MNKINIAQIAGKILSEKGYVSATDLFLVIGCLDQKKLNTWKSGQAPYLELMVRANLHKLSTAMKELKSWAIHSNLKPSITIYKHKGHLLRFSKSGNSNIETAYSTHYVLQKSDH